MTDEQLTELQADLATYRNSANYWWAAYYQATTGKIPQPFSSDPEQDRSVREMAQREHGQATTIAELKQEAASLRNEVATANLKVLELQRELDNVAAQIANEGPRNLEHLMALGMLGKHTTVIGRVRLRQLHSQIHELERLYREERRAYRRTEDLLSESHDAETEHRLALARSAPSVSPASPVLDDPVGDFIAGAME